MPDLRFVWPNSGEALNTNILLLLGRFLLPFCALWVLASRGPEVWAFQVNSTKQHKPSGSHVKITRAVQYVVTLYALKFRTMTNSGNGSDLVRRQICDIMTTALWYSSVIPTISHHANLEQILRKALDWKAWIPKSSLLAFECYVFKKPVSWIRDFNQYFTRQVD